MIKSIIKSIKIDQTNKETEFFRLEISDTFIHGTGLFIKIPPVMPIFGRGTVYNAIRLKPFALVRFDCGELVYPVDILATFNVEEVSEDD